MSRTQDPSLPRNRRRGRTLLKATATAGVFSAAVWGGCDGPLGGLFAGPPPGTVINPDLGPLPLPGRANPDMGSHPFPGVVVNDDGGFRPPPNDGAILPGTVITDGGTPNPCMPGFFPGVVVRTDAFVCTGFFPGVIVNADLGEGAPDGGAGPDFDAFFPGIRIMSDAGK